MIEADDPTATFLAAKQAADDARAALVAELDNIKHERETNLTAWRNREKAIHELLRVRAAKPRKPRIEAAPEAKKAKA